MAARHTLPLSPEEQLTLEEMRDKHPKAYLRQRAAALLKIAGGLSPNWVAQNGLYRPVEADTVYDWLKRYTQHGLGGLYVRPGRGRKPAFFPLSPRQASERLRDIVAQDPRNFNVDMSRWTLQALLRLCQDWVRGVSLVAMWRILRRSGIHYKRGQLTLHSPDPSYARKRQRMAEVEEQVRAQPDRFVLLYLDEMTYTRQPTVANAYAPSGATQPTARLGYRPNSENRILAAVNALTGRVHALLRSHTTVATLREFWKTLRRAYPQAQVLYVVVDNWPVHYHPDGLAVLQPQPYASDFIVPSTWSQQPQPVTSPGALPIVLLPLPTYASWLNPIEKLWRWLRQTVTHLHKHGDDLNALKADITVFLDRFAQGSQALLRYIGLLPA